MENNNIAGQPTEITEYRGRGTTGTDDDYNINKDEFRSACIKYVERQLRGRHKNNVLKDEVDFFAGAPAKKSTSSLSTLFLCLPLSCLSTYFIQADLNSSLLIL